MISSITHFRLVNYLKCLEYRRCFGILQSPIVRKMVLSFGLLFRILSLWRTRRVSASGAVRTSLVERTLNCRMTLVASNDGCATTTTFSFFLFWIFPSSLLLHFCFSVFAVCECAWEGARVVGGGLGFISRLYYCYSLLFLLLFSCNNFNAYAD